MRINQSGASAAYLSAAVSKVSRFHAATILMLVAFDGLTLSPSLLLASVGDTRRHGGVSPSNHIQL
jgi:hypothetical protein